MDLYYKIVLIIAISSIALLILDIAIALELKSYAIYNKELKLNKELEKRIPKKVNKTDMKQEDDYLMCKCPSCHMTMVKWIFFDDDSYYCNHCGQAIDWSEKNE